MGSLKVEHIIRVTAERSDPAAGDPIVHEYTAADLVRAGYNWGRVDGKASAEGKPLFGEGADWTTGTVPLTELRSTFESPRRDG